MSTEYFPGKDGIIIESIAITDDRCKFQIDERESVFVMTDEAIQADKGAILLYSISSFR